MRILFVAMANSVHTARWIKQLTDQGWDIHLFPVEDAGIHPDLRNLTVHDFLCHKPSELHQSVGLVGSWPFSRGAGLAQRVVRRFAPSWLDRAGRLARTIRLLKPDIVHSLEIQHAGYLTLAARDQVGGQFPPWIVTNWGSDIYLFGQLEEHRRKIRSLLAVCDYYSCECHRDVELAHALGLKGKVLPVLPNTGGFDLERIKRFRQPGKTSSRKLIVLKGYQNWAGRALVGLRALELCSDLLQGYRVAIYLAPPDVELKARLSSQSIGIPFEIIPMTAQENILRLHGQARISIGLSIGDAISTSFLEALVMGAFPIQSATACINEWAICGQTALFVPPEDPVPIAAAIRHALTDDALVDRASDLNAQMAKERLDYKILQPRVTSIYQQVFEDTSHARKGLSE